jgi:penicillin-binding protein 1A
MADVVSPGDVVLVEPVAGQPPAANRLARGERAVLRQMPQVEGALVALDPATGRVLAMAGGWSFERSQFNRATQAQRQPGSSFKPFVYIAALEAGIGPGEPFLDAPFVVDTGGGGRWRPANFSNNFYGRVSLSEALQRSLNLVTVRVADRVGLEHVAQAAQRFGVVDDMPRVFPAALGAVETTVLRQAAAYAGFANGGKRVEPTLIDSVQDRSGRVLWRAAGRSCSGCEDPTIPPSLRDDRRWATDPVAAGQMVAMMQGVVSAGTGTRAGGGLGRPVGGKTGTTNDFLDNWFVGFTADLVVAVWVGFDTPTPLGGDSTGGATAAPIFRDFVGAALNGRPPVPFPPFVRPPGESFAYLRPPADPTRGSAGPQPGGAVPAGGGRAGSAGLDAGLGGLY